LPVITSTIQAAGNHLPLSLGLWRHFVFVIELAENIHPFAVSDRYP